MRINKNGQLEVAGKPVGRNGQAGLAAAAAPQRNTPPTFYAGTAASGKGHNAEFAADMREVHSGYFAGGTSRYLPQPSGINPLGTGSDYHYRTEREYFLMVERARADDRDNMILGQGVNRMVANIMRDGFNLIVETGDQALDDDLAARWREWSESKSACDYEGERTFNQLANLALRHRTIDGDVFAVPLADGRLQLVENHRVRNPISTRNRVRNGTGIVHGVEMQGGRRVAYHFTGDDLQPTAVIGRGTRMRRVPARDAGGNRQVWHILDWRRLSQRRGVTCVAPIVFPLRYHDDLQFAALVNAKRASVISYIHQFAASVPGAPAGGGPIVGSRDETTRADGTTETTEAAHGPGNVIRATQPGETIQPWSPNIPSPSFFEHSALLISIVAINLDLPEIVFLLDASRGNFNSYRGVIDQARQRFEQIQSDLRCGFHDEAYGWKLRQWAAEDPALRRAAERSDVAYYRHRFTPRGWPYLQPVQDAAADDLRLSRNLTSARRRSQERGIEYADLVREIVEDRSLLIRTALQQAEEINSDYPAADVKWHHLAFGQEGGVRINLSGTVDDETEADTTKDAE